MWVQIECVQHELANILNDLTKRKVEIKEIIKLDRKDNADFLILYIERGK